jgi:hypothetical protein
MATQSLEAFLARWPQERFLAPLPDPTSRLAAGAGTA